MYKRVILLLIVLTIFVYDPLIANGSQSLWRGPLYVTNNFPTTLIFFSATPEDINVVPTDELRYRLGITEANTIIIDQKGNTEAIIDLEITRVNLALSKGITDRLDVGIELPLLFYHRGFMDTYIEGAEKIVGKSTRVRNLTKRDDIRYFLKKDGEIIYDIDKNVAGIGDITLKWKYLLLRDIIWLPDIALKFDLNIPSGKKNLALGSGEFDFGPTIILHKGINNLHLFINIGYLIFNDLQLDRFKSRLTTTKIETINFFTSTLALEYYFKNISWLVQFSANSNPFKQFGIEDIDNSGEALSLGVKYSVNNFLIQFSTTENISSVAFPDFSMDLVLEYRMKIF